MSALTGERTPKLLEVVDQVAAARVKRVPTPELNAFLESVTAAHPPSSQSGARCASSTARRPASTPPAFVLFTNVASELHFSYERFWSTSCASRSDSRARRFG